MTFCWIPRSLNFDFVTFCTSKAVEIHVTVLRAALIGYIRKVRSATGTPVYQTRKRKETNLPSGVGVCSMNFPEPGTPCKLSI